MNIFLRGQIIVSILIVNLVLQAQCIWKDKKEIYVVLRSAIFDIFCEAAMLRLDNNLGSLQPTLGL
jgi:hypothetical protein